MYYEADYRLVQGETGTYAGHCLCNNLFWRIGIDAPVDFKEEQTEIFLIAGCRKG